MNRKLWLVWLRQRISKHHAFSRSLRGLAWVGLFLFAIFVYLNRVGLPSFVGDAFERRMETMGYSVEFSRVRLHWTGSLVADDIRLFTLEDTSVPLVEARSFALQIDLLDLLAGQPGLKSMTVIDGVARLTTEGQWSGYDDSRAFLLEQISAKVVIAPQGFHVMDMSANLFGVKVDGQGFLVRSSVPRAEGRKVAHPLAQARRVSPAWVGALAEQLHAVVFADEPIGRLDFMVHPDQPSVSEVVLDLQGGKTRVRGVLFDHWQLGVRLDGPAIRLTHLVAQRADRKVRASATYETKEGVLAAQVYSDLPVTHWSSLIPLAWRDRLVASGLQLSGPATFEVELGPAPVQQVMEQIQGRIKIKDASLKGMYIDEFAVDLSRQGPIVTCTNGMAVIGRGQKKGPAVLWARLNLTNLAYEGYAEVGFNPSVLMPVMTPSQQRILRTFMFEEHRPHAYANFGGRVGDPTAMNWKGRLQATNFYYNGVFISAFEAMASTTNEVMTMDPFHVVRPEGEVVGRTEQNFANGTVYLDVVSTADPKMVARALGPSADESMRIYRVEGPCRVEARGVVDYLTNVVTDLHVKAEGENFGIEWFVAETCAFDLHAKGPDVMVSNIVGRLYGGDFEADVEISGVGHTDAMPYTVAFAFTNVDFADVVVTLRQSTRDPYIGFMSGWGEVAGIVGEGRSDTVTGRGYLNIREGAFWSIPLLGGLSKLIAFLNPTWDFASQTDFSTHFELRDRKVFCDDVVLDGKLLRVTAKGNYAFNDKLDFNVQVKPLREGMFAQLLQLVTKPLSVLLAFQLDGSIKDPQWRPKNLPREFQREPEP